jgi:hypothetical protein
MLTCNSITRRKEHKTNIQLHKKAVPRRTCINKLKYVSSCTQNTAKPNINSYSTCMHSSYSSVKIPNRTLLTVKCTSVMITSCIDRAEMKKISNKGSSLNVGAGRGKVNSGWVIEKLNSCRLSVIVLDAPVIFLQRRILR